MSESVPENESDFWEAFRSSPEAHRYPYELNRSLVVLLVFFAVTVLCLALTVSVGMNIPPWARVLLWVATAALSIGVAAVIFLWRTFTRRSAVLVTPRSLVWLDTGRVSEVPWPAITRERFAEALSGAKRTQGQLCFDVDGAVRQLPVYRPYMRIRGFQRLMIEILEHVQAQEEGSGP